MFSEVVGLFKDYNNIEEINAKKLTVQKIEKTNWYLTLKKQANDLDMFYKIVCLVEFYNYVEHYNTIQITGFEF